MDKKHCIGCDSNFYNGNNPLGVKECWCLKDAELVTRYCISWNVPQNDRKNFFKVKVPSCYTETGRYGYYKEIPKHLTTVPVGGKT